MLKLQELHLKKIIFIGFLFLFFAGPVLAGTTFPNDTISVYTSVNTMSSTTIYTSNTTSTILYFFTTHDWGDGADTLYCGNTAIFSFPTKTDTIGDAPPLEFIYFCNKNVYYRNGGSADTDQTLIAYVPYDLRTGTTGSSGTSTNTLTLISNSSTGASFYIDSRINYGDVIVILFLLLFVIFGIVKVITDFWIPHRVIRKS
jgi:hypothetical protein